MNVMANRFILLIILLISIVQFSKAQQQNVSVHYSNISFVEYCDKLSSQTDVNIFYPYDIFKEYPISINVDKIKLIDAIREVINLDSFSVFVWNNSIIVSSGSRPISSLPNYGGLNRSKDSDKDKGEEKQNNISTTLASARKKIIIGSKSMSSNALASVMCRVTDSESGKSLPGATLYIVELKKGTISNKNGEASLFINPGKYTLKILYMGMKTKIYQLVVYSTGHFSVSLDKEGYELSRVDILGDKQMNMRQKDAGLEKMTARAIKEIPVMVGEPDIVKASTMLPGIVSVGEGSSGLNVRGGNSDQNAFYINNIPILNTSHLFGFFPAFNADLVKNFTIYKGYIPAEYGGRLSSVFDIQTRKGNRKKFSLHGGVSPIALNGVMSVPILKDKLSFIVSGRRSYSDWILRRIDDYDISSSSSRFNDISVGVYLDLPKLHISTFLYHSADNFSYSNVNNYKYSNDGFSLNISQNYSKKLKATYSLVTYQYQFTTRDYQFASEAYSHKYLLGQQEFKAKLNYLINDNYFIDLGYHFTYNNLNRGVVEPLGYSKVSEVNLGRDKAMENALFIINNYSPWQWLNLNVGFRMNVYNPLGPKSVYLYYDDKTISNQYIKDTLKYGNNEIINTSIIPEIRFSANIDIDRLSSLKFAFNQMHQNLFMLNTTFSISPRAQWKMADYYLKPSKSSQISVGYFKSFLKNGLESSVELYYKNTNNYTEFKDGAEFLNSPNIEQDVLQGRQWSYGLEFMLKRKGDYRLTGWLAYTYSRALIHINGDEDFQKINDGKVYPASFDIPHVFSGLINLKISKRLSFSTTINYQSGRPITYPTSIYYVNNMSFVDYSERNAYRIPSYFRVDASLTIEGSLKRKKFMHSSLVFSIYNITGRDNPYSVYFIPSYSGIRTYQYSVISIPVFTATWLFKLGNFDSN